MYCKPELYRREREHAEGIIVLLLRCSFAEIIITCFRRKNKDMHPLQLKLFQKRKPAYEMMMHFACKHEIKSSTNTNKKKKLNSKNKNTMTDIL